MTSTEFDPVDKEKALRREAEGWDTNSIQKAEPGDIPVIDLTSVDQDEALRTRVVSDLRAACKNVGFYSIVGHGVSQNGLATLFQQASAFHGLPLSEKLAVEMDKHQGKVPGAGYLPMYHRKLPRREKGNGNEAFIVKASRELSLSDNPWPDPVALPGFRTAVENYADEIDGLCRKLLPLYAEALGLDSNFFAEAFEVPLIRLRMTHYPPAVPESDAEFGIAPHVDTSFMTILAQDNPGLCVFSEKRQCWIEVPLVEGALVVNTGELLKQWSNDEFISVKHFANNEDVGSASRYSIPCFVNADPDYVMSCLPTCMGPDRPARYPPISYNQSQGIVQGE